MKKLLCIVAALFCLTACGGGEEKEVACTASSSQTGYKTEGNIDFTYAGDLVKTQNQKSVLKFDSKEIYDEMLPYVKASALEDKTKSMEGVTYKIGYDDETFTVTETLNIDITKISAKDYASLSGLSESSLKGMKVSMEKTRENIIKQGYSCSAMD